MRKNPRQLCHIILYVKILSYRKNNYVKMLLGRALCTLTKKDTKVDLYRRHFNCAADVYRKWKSVRRLPQNHHFHS